MKFLTRLAEGLRARIGDDWKHSWRFGSVQLHAFATTVAVGLADYMANNPTALRDMVAQLPERFRLPALVAGGGVWLAIGWLVRVWRGVHRG
jgi:hypothetical protein